MVLLQIRECRSNLETHMFSSTHLWGNGSANPPWNMAANIKAIMLPRADIVAGRLPPRN